MNTSPSHMARNFDFDQTVRNTLAPSLSGRMLGATHFVNGQRHFVRIIECNPFGIDPTLIIVECDNESEARGIFNDMQCDSDAVLERLSVL